MLCLSDFELYSRWVPLTKVDWRNIKLLYNNPPRKRSGNPIISETAA